MLEHVADGKKRAEAGAGRGIIVKNTSLWNRIIEHWRQCNIPFCHGVSPGEIARFEARYGVALPNDVRDYFLAVNGTGQEMDPDLYRFWPLIEVNLVQEILTATNPGQKAYQDCFVFADHCISCWDYAVRLTSDPRQPAPVFRVTGGMLPGEMMRASFREFMEMYVANPRNII